MLRAIFLRVLVVLAVPIAFFRPFMGLLIYLWFSFGRPGDFVWRGERFDYLIWIAGACLIGFFLFEMNQSPLRFKGMILLLLLWGWLVLASLMAFDDSLAYPKLWEYSRGFVMAFVTASMANSEKRVRQILFVLAVSLGLLGVKSAVDALMSGFSSTVVGPGGMLSEQNEYALGLDMAIPILMWLARDDQRDWVRWVLRIMAACSSIAVIGTRSRSGLLGLLMAGLILTLYSKRKLLACAGVTAGLVALFLVGPKGALERYSTISTAAEKDGSAIGRLEAWDAAIQMTKRHPVFGVGLRNFVLVFPQYSNAEPRVTHNVVFDMMSETGIPGCLLFLAMIFMTIGQMFWLARKAQRNPQTEHLATYCRVVAGSLMVYMVPNMFINRQDFDLMYQLVAVGAGLAALTATSLRTATHPETEMLPEPTAPVWLCAP
jgi:probable O-glycosylation ligase (exosortase A-associated)